MPGRLAWQETEEENQEKDGEKAVFRTTPGRRANLMELKPPAMRRLGAIGSHLVSASASSSTMAVGAPATTAPARLTAAQKTQFLEDGFCFVPGFLDAARLQTVRDAVERRVELEGERGGWEGGHSGVARRLCNLFTKGDTFTSMAVEPICIEGAALSTGLSESEVTWNAMNFHDPIPGEVARQHIHADRGFFPSCEGYFNVIIALDDMTEENGATRLVPKSHRRPWPNQEPGNELLHIERAPLDDTLDDIPGEIKAICPAGSAVFCHGDLWHGACDNHSTGTRRVIHLGFACPSTRPQYEIAGALPDTTRALYPQTLQLAPFQNWWRVPANYKSEGISEAAPPAAKTEEGTETEPSSASSQKYSEPVFTGDEASGKSSSPHPHIPHLILIILP